MTFPAAEVECLCLDLAALRPGLAALAASLSDDERARAARLSPPAHRERLLLRRGLLRRLLGARLGRDPASLAFRRGPAGKPALLDGALRYSATSPGDRFAVAFAHGVEVELDVERLRSPSDPDLAADPVLSARDRARVAALAGPARAEAYVRAFTVQEALGKWRGWGIVGGRGGPDLPLDALLRDGTFSLPLPEAPGLTAVTRGVGASAVLALVVGAPLPVRFALGPFDPTRTSGAVVAPTRSG